MALFKKDKKKEAKAETKAGAKPDTKSAGHPLDWVIKQPRVTEKAALLIEKNTYTFDVNPKANRTQVKQAITAKYKVHPLKVNIIKHDAHMTRRRGRKVKVAGYKKALVTLPANESIDLV
jgi:large subunit ribosomal protein L23